MCFPSEPFKTVSKESIAVTQTPASQTPRRVNIEPPKTGVALLSFAETNDDEDYTGEFDIKPDILSNSHGHNSVEDLHLVHRTEYSQDDVFAEMEDETFPTLCGRDDSYNRNVAAADFQMEKLMSKLTKNVQTLSSEELNSLISEVLELLVNYEFTRKQVISLHGLSAMLEVLSDQSIQNDPHEEVIENILHCVSEVIIENFQVLENFCLVGGISLVCYFVSKKFRYSVRYQSVIIIDLLCQSSDVSLQSFLSCGGLGILAMLLEEDYFEHSEFNIVSTSALWKLFNLKGSTSRNDICRVLARRGVLGHLSYILIKLILERERGKDPKVKHNSSHSKLSEGNAVVEKDFDQLIQEIVEILVNCSQTTSEIKAMMASRQVFIRVFKCYSRLNKVQQIMVLKFVKNFSSVESNFQLLQNSNAIEKLVYILEKSRKDEQRYKDVSSQILPTMFNLCRLSTSRQEEAALAGLVPHLQLLAKGNSPLKQFSLPILCDLAHNGRACRNILWKHHVLSSYLYLVSDPNWQTNAYEAIGSWLQDDTSQIEQKLTESGACSQLVSGISKAKSEDYNGVLESFLRILLQSQKICRSLPLPDLCFRIKRLLQHSKPVVRLGLLKILKTVFKFNPDRTYLLLEMKDILQPLASTSESVLVKQLAIELLSKINTKK